MLLEVVVLILLVVMVLEVAEDVPDPLPPPPPLEPKHRLLENVTVVVGEDLTLSWLLPN